MAVSPFPFTEHKSVELDNINNEAVFSAAYFVDERKPMNFPVKTIVLLASLVLASAASAARPECDVAADLYNQQVENVAEKMAAYRQCFAESEGNDDCAKEFKRLRSAQDDLESAVGDVQNYCY
ncbi:hypothetical protein [Rhodomicrobium lacus]|uniref:hypothetical protein n=1 Tax=Rhodomicrobium lacus TaxID=2498452 RepID=UPI0026E299B6|nr:hypothetical protein [Rhodomicrobium lacus]WKW50123.1 hypothetical protein QMO75_12610 [Rhodomicrobium lacus]